MAYLHFLLWLLASLLLATSCLGKQVSLASLKATLLLREFVASYNQQSAEAAQMRCQLANRQHEHECILYHKHTQAFLAAIGWQLQSYVGFAVEPCCGGW